MNMSLLKNEHPRTIARAAILLYKTKRGLGYLVQRLKKLNWPGLRLSLDVEAYIIPNVFETERDVIRALETKLKWAYCREIGSDSIVGLEQCDAFYDWVARLDKLRPPQEATYPLSEFDRQVIALALLGMSVRQGPEVFTVVSCLIAKIDAESFLACHAERWSEWDAALDSEYRRPV